MGKIKNFENLATNPGRKVALQIAEAGLLAIDTRKIVKEKIYLTDGKLCIKDYWCSLESTKRIFVVGAGKCAMEAASALEEVLGDRHVRRAAAADAVHTEVMEAVAGDGQVIAIEVSDPVAEFMELGIGDADIRAVADHHGVGVIVRIAV